jgi:hypothetical protein
MYIVDEEHRAAGLNNMVSDRTDITTKQSDCNDDEDYIVPAQLQDGNADTSSSASIETC